MYKPYKMPVIKVSPDVNVREPRISKFVCFLLRVFTRLYTFIFFGVAKTVLDEEHVLYDAFLRALSGKSRIIIAFRHPNGGEPQHLTWFFLSKFIRLAARKKIHFPMRPHAVFVYGFEVVRWGGWVARFIMPNVGAMPIHHAKMDSKGMARIYKAIMDGPYPVAIAPEGKVSYTADTIPRLEPGVIRIGFHAADRLAEKKADYPVEVLPLSIHFRFGSWGRITLELLMRRTEKACGLRRIGRWKVPFTERFNQCREHIIEANERRYQLKTDTSLSFEERLDLVINAAMESAERIAGMKSEEGEDFFFRMHRMRQLYWDRIFLPGVETLDDRTRIERSTLDLQAGEAWYIGRHLELVDLGWHFRVPLPAENAPLHEKIEYAQNLWDFASRSMGGALSNRKNIFPKNTRPLANQRNRTVSKKRRSAA
jgi:1-acyl-sn-glycerol-3-phosphate acyltransferase